MMTGTETQQQKLVTRQEYQLARKTETVCRYWGLEENEHVFVRPHPLAEDRAVQVFRIVAETMTQERKTIIDNNPLRIARYAHEGWARNDSCEFGRKQYQKYVAVLEQGVLIQ